MASLEQRNKPQPGVNYPMTLAYCGECSMPLEYCEYHPNYQKCKQWLEKNLPDEFDKLVKLGDDRKDDADGNTEEEKKPQKRGGRGNIKTKNKKKEPQNITLSRAPRGKKKFVTVITGLSSFEIDLKDAAKYFSHRFSCGSSVTGEDEIVIQGDVKDDLMDAVTEKWPEISEDSIEDLGDLKR
uniref:Density-regulated protein n=1 Tax=Strigamia maritima TaxID=126957 RepID=T1IJW4_STRMM